MLKMTVVVLAGWVLLHALVADAQPADWPQQASDVLRRFVGDWDTDTTIHRVTFPPQEFHTLGTAVCQPALGNRYYEFRSASIPPGEADLQIMTFDAAAGVFQQWVFDADGYRHTAEGRWNPTTSTLTWTGRADGTSFTIEDHWVSADRLEWTLKRTDATGQLVQRIDGTLRRRKANQ